MFEFYRIVTDPDTDTGEIKKFRYEETSPLNLSQSVFKDDVFVGYMIDDVFYVMPGSGIQVYEDMRGATSVEIIESIRKKDDN